MLWCCYLSCFPKIVEIRPEEERFLRLLEILGEWYEKGKLIIFVGSQVRGGKGQCLAFCVSHGHMP